MRLAEAAADFLSFCAVERRLSRHTLDAYKCDLNDFGKWLPVEPSGVSGISEQHLKGYLTELVSQRRLATSTVRRRFACLRAFVARMVALGRMTDPFATWHPELRRQSAYPARFHARKYHYCSRSRRRISLLSMRRWLRPPG